MVLKWFGEQGGTRPHPFEVGIGSSLPGTLKKTIEGLEEGGFFFGTYVTFYVWFTGLPFTAAKFARIISPPPPCLTVSMRSLIHFISDLISYVYKTKFHSSF